MKSKCLAVLVLLSPAAFGMSFKAQIQPLKLPLSIAAGMPAPISNTKPGEMTVGMHRICGDGDVANFKSSHPTFEIVPNTMNSMKYVIGYWVAPVGSTNPLPTPDNFYTLGYGTMDIAANSSELTPSNKFIPMNYSSKDGFNGMELFGKESAELHEQAKRSMAANLGAPANPIRIFGGVFTCMNMDDESAMLNLSDSSQFVPGHTEIGNYLGHQDALPKLAETAGMTDKFKLDFNSSPADNTLYKVDYGAKALPFAIQFGSGPDQMTGAIFNNYDLVKNLDYPAGLTDEYNPAGCEALTPVPDPCVLVKTKEQKYDEFINSKISSLAPGGSEADLCSRVGITVNGDYKWEFFKQNSACRHFLRNYYSPSQTYVSAYMAIAPGGVYISSGQFNSARDAMARRLFVGSVIENVHNRIQSDSRIKTKATLARPNCFDKGTRPLIERVIGSYPIAMKLESGSYKVQSNPFNHVHPEPLFALADATVYYANDKWAIFGQVTQTSSFLTFPVGGCIPTSDGATYDPMGMDSMYVDCETGAPMEPVSPETMPTPLSPETIDPNNWSFVIPHGNATEMSNNKIDSNSIKADKIDIIFKIRSLGDVPNCPWFC